MAVNPCPLSPKPQFEVAAGTPAVGALLFFYVSNSTTKQNTYTNSVGNVANANPVVLNALGMPTNEIWFTAGQTYTVVYAPAGDTDPPSSPIFTINGLTGINDITSAVTEWIAGPTPTYVSATQFTLVGDQTGTFQVGRRLKTTNTGGTVYSTISVSAFAAVTTVTVINDSSTLDSGLSAVSYGILSATNPSALPFVAFPATMVPSSNTHTLDDYNELPSYTGTLTGCTTSPAYTIYVTKIGNLVTMDCPAWTGTSNTTAKTITGMPAAVRPATTKTFFVATADNSGSYVMSSASISASGVLTFAPSLTSATWTNSGVASGQGFSLTYTVN